MKQLMTYKSNIPTWWTWIHWQKAAIKSESEPYKSCKEVVFIYGDWLQSAQRGLAKRRGNILQPAKFIWIFNLLLLVQFYAGYVWRRYFIGLIYLIVLCNSTVRLCCKQDNGLFDTQVQSGKASSFYLPFSIV